MLVSRFGQQLAVRTVLVRAVGVLAALFLLLILVVGCGGQSSTTDNEEKAQSKQQTKPETRPNKREVAIEEGALGDLVQEQVGDFRLQKIDENSGETKEFIRRFNVDAVEDLRMTYRVPGGGPSLAVEHILITVRSPEAANNLRQKEKERFLKASRENWEVVYERPVEASGRQVGTVTMLEARRPGRDEEAEVLWNNGNVLAWVASGDGDAIKTAENFYESVPY